MDTILLTGGTGYLGSYVAAELLRTTDRRLALLIRAKDRRDAIAKVWKGWQLLMGPEELREHLPRLTFVSGDLHAPDLGIPEDQRAWLGENVGSVLHVAASLNRKSEKACLNTNLRGTLSVIRLARWLHERRGLDRFGFVSTVAVAGHRSHEDVGEDEAIDWARSDYDPYARTKKFCEHMVRELLPDVPTTIYRPSIVMGDARFPETTQFDMIFATCMLADLPVLPLDRSLRVDIVNADWVGRAIARLHTAPGPRFDTYHLSAGRSSPRVGDITDALDAHLGRRTRFAPALDWAWDKVYRAMNRAPKGTPARGIGALWKVFWPYVTYDTVFLNDRAVSDVGEAPTPFPTYFPALYDWVKAHRFRYPHRPLPEDLG